MISNPQPNFKTKGDRRKKNKLIPKLPEGKRERLKQK